VGCVLGGRANAYMGTCGIVCGNGTDEILPIIGILNLNVLRRTLRMFLAISETGCTGTDRTFNDGFALEVSANVWKQISQGQDKQQDKARTLENEGAVRLPDIKNPLVSTEVEIYSARAISGYKNLVWKTILDTFSPERPHIGVRRHGETFVEVGVLHESKTLIVLKMAKIPKDLRQILCIGSATESL